MGPAVRVDRPNGRAPMVLVCEHASRRIPMGMGGLGLNTAAAKSHAAWDIGALALAKGLSAHLDAPLVAGGVSRLVYDCNRAPGAPDAMPARSEVHDIPGNVGLSPAACADRVAQIYDPFHAAVADALASQGPDAALVTLHSFAPVYHDAPRDVQLGLLHGPDDRLAQAMLGHAERSGWEARLNAPYGPADGVLHTLDRHAKDTPRPSVMIELRNDLLGTPDQIADAARTLSAIITAALADLGLGQAQRE